MEHETNVFNCCSDETSATQHHMNTLVINRKLILIAPKLWFGRTHVLTINQGLEEVGYWQHNAPAWPDVCLSDKQFGQRKNQVSAGYSFEVCLYCFFFFLQIKETGAFVVGGWRNVRKEAAILCHYILFQIGSHWKGHVLYLQERRSSITC